MIRDIPLPQPTSLETARSREQRISQDCDLIIVTSNSENPRFTLNHFSDIYPQKVIEADLQLVEKIKKGFIEKHSRLSDDDKVKIEQSKKRSEALEAIIADQIESGDWFGSNSLFLRATEYDDLTNNVDVVVEFNVDGDDHPEHIALSIDSTSRTDATSINKKIDRNIAKIFSNRLQVKYFESPNLDASSRYKGPLQDVVPVVIGLDAVNTAFLIGNFAELIRLNQKKKDINLNPNERTQAGQEYSRLRRIVESDPAQLVFLDEIKHQLSLYTTLLEKNSSENVNLKTSSVFKLMGIIEDIIDQKKYLSMSSRMETLKGDRVYDQIKNCCSLKSVSPGEATPVSIQEDPDGSYYL